MVELRVKKEAMAGILLCECMRCGKEDIYVAELYLKGKESCECRKKK